MSRTFSTNSGSVDSLKVSARGGFSAKACQMRQTAVWLRPVARASERVLQCVALVGLGRGDRPFNLLARDLARGSRPGLVEQAVQPALGEAASPQRHCRAADAEPPGNAAIGRAWFGAGQDDARTGGERLSCL